MALTQQCKTFFDFLLLWLSPSLTVSTIIIISTICKYSYQFYKSTALISKAWNHSDISAGAASNNVFPALLTSSKWGYNNSSWCMSNIMFRLETCAEVLLLQMHSPSPAGSMPSNFSGPSAKEFSDQAEEKKTSPVRKCLDKESDCSGWGHMPIPEPSLWPEGWNNIIAQAPGY